MSFINKFYPFLFLLFIFIVCCVQKFLNDQFLNADKILEFWNFGLRVPFFPFVISLSLLTCSHHQDWISLLMRTLRKWDTGKLLYLMPPPHLLLDF